MPSTGGAGGTSKGGSARGVTKLTEGAAVRSKQPPASSGASGDDLGDLMELLKAHNSKHKPVGATKPSYEPRTSSVSAMREWEKKSGKKYLTLSVEERIAANQEINSWAKAAVS